MTCGSNHNNVAAVAVLLTAMPVAAFAQGLPAQGGCYQSGQIPQLPSHARVFVIATLEAESTGPGGRPHVVTLAKASVLIAKSSTPGDDLTIVPGEKAVTLRARPSVCVYPADAPLPPIFASKKPDIVVP